MIPFEDYKRLLGSSAQDMKDEEIERLRNLQYQWADMIFDTWIKGKNSTCQTQENDLHIE
jgi:hypothetical protein